MCSLEMSMRKELPLPKKNKLTCAAVIKQSDLFSCGIEASEPTLDVDVVFIFRSEDKILLVFNIW